MWAQEIGRMAGASVPVQAVEHMYLMTEPMKGLAPDIPSLRDYDGLTYFKEDAGKLIMGGSEPNARPWAIDGIPEDFHFTLLNEDWDKFEPLVDAALVRLPALQSVGIRQLLVGPESFTPDGNYLLGETAEVRNFYVAAGFNSVGITSAGGAGRALAEWIVEDAPTLDLSDVDIRRFHPFQNTKRYLSERVSEIVSTAFAMHWPHKQMDSARPLRRSPFYDRLLGRGACFGEAAGWERPHWFAQPGQEPRYVYSFGRQNWFSNAAAEHGATRERVTLFDETSFTKLLLEGSDATALLQKLCSKDMDVVAGRIVYTNMLNARGGIECDLTVTRMAADGYFLVCGAGAFAKVSAWIRRHMAGYPEVTLTDLSSAYAVIGVMGPKSRELLSRLTNAQLTNEAFPFLSSREIELGCGVCRASRVTFVGELGWELYIPTEFAAAAYDALIAQGQDLGVMDAGYHALDSLRIESGYRHFGHDIGGTDTPLEAGLGFAVDFAKADDFVGRETLERQREKPLRRRMAVFVLDDPEPLLFRNEPIWREGTLVGRITSGAFGHTVGRAIGLGYIESDDGVDAAFISDGAYEIEIACERFSASAQLMAPYDPKRERVKM
jgi:4-methylaminobutanoate oxidase (formaldehyde-forming)